MPYVDKTRAKRTVRGIGLNINRGKIMQEVIKVKVKSEEDWHAQRKKGIGGSDVSVIMGVNPYKTPFELWTEKTGRVAPKKVDNAKVHWGNILESVVADEYTKVTGQKVQKCNFTLQHKDFPFLQANLDRVAVIDNVPPLTTKYFNSHLIIECKTAGEFMKTNWGKEGTDDIPKNYLCQCLHYMGITGATDCHIPVLIGGSDFRIYKITRTAIVDKAISSIQQKCIKWWNDHVINDTEPALINKADAIAKFPMSRANPIEADDDIQKKVWLLKDINKDIKEKEKLKKELEGEVTVFMGENDTLLGTDGSKIATWKSARGSYKTSWKDVAESFNPTQEDIDAHTIETQGSRRFLVK